MPVDIITITTKTMTDLKSLIRLQAWLSPAFPTGAFSYSSGLEQAVDTGLVTTKQSLHVWLLDVLQSGAGWNDAVLLAHAWRTKTLNQDFDELITLARALYVSNERLLETTQQGNAMLAASKAWTDTSGDLPDQCPLPVAVGYVAATMDVGIEETCAAYLHAYLSNQIQAALRLMKLGQQGGVELLSHLEDPVLDIASRASKSTLDDLGGCAILADIMSMQHETMPSRIFRS